MRGSQGAWKKRTQAWAEQRAQILLAVRLSAHHHWLKLDWDREQVRATSHEKHICYSNEVGNRYRYRYEPSLLSRENRHLVLYAKDEKDYPGII